jgi:hypothetical protein
MKMSRDVRRTLYALEDSTTKIIDMYVWLKFKILNSWVDNPRPIGCPQIKWCRTPKKALQSNDLPTESVKWREMAADRNQWRPERGRRVQVAPHAIQDDPRESTCKEVLCFSMKTAILRQRGEIGTSKRAVEVCRPIC